jgi:hypothetical protein
MPPPRFEPNRTFPMPGAGLEANPVQQIQKNHLNLTEKERLKTAATMFGYHSALRMVWDRNELSQSLRLPGLSSSLVGLGEVTDIDDSIYPEDIFGQPDALPVLRPSAADLHSVMEDRLGMTERSVEVTDLNLTQQAFGELAQAQRI